MLNLLLDEHLSPRIAEGLRNTSNTPTVYGLAEWEGGRFLGMADEAILEEAGVQNLTFVTYDLKTIPPLLKTWMEAGHHHGGVIFVDNKTIPPSDFGALIRVLRKLYQDCAKWDWKNRVVFLRR